MGSNTLSQKEIDSLIKSLNSGKTPIKEDSDLKKSKKQIKEYNFKKPSKFNKEQLKSLEIIFESYARIAASFFTGYLRTNTSIDFIRTEQLTYDEFNNALTNPVLLGIVEFKPFKGSIILEISASIGFTIIDRLLGGKGYTIQKLRDFSDIEKAILEKVITQMLNHLIEPWENIEKITPRLEKIESNYQFAQIITPNETVAIISLNIKIGEVTGVINFCIPHIVIEPAITKLNTKYWFSKIDEKEENGKNIEELSKKLDEISIPISATIGKAYVSVSEFLSLGIGDVITLDSFVSTDLDILVGNLLKFRGKPGIRRGKNSVQITTFVDKGGVTKDE